MPSRPPMHRPAGYRSEAERKQEYNQQRKSARQRGYTTRWDKARLAFLAEHPLCVECERLGLTVAATTVDHVRPHRGDDALFWNKNNWQSLCTHCHNSHKQSEEKGRRRQIIDESGWPI